MYLVLGPEMKSFHRHLKGMTLVIELSKSDTARNSTLHQQLQAPEHIMAQRIPISFQSACSIQHSSSDALFIVHV